MEKGKAKDLEERLLEERRKYLELEKELSSLRKKAGTGQPVPTRPAMGSTSLPGTRRRRARGRPQAPHLSQQHPAPPVPVEGEHPEPGARGRRRAGTGGAARGRWGSVAQLVLELHNVALELPAAWVGALIVEAML